MFRRARNRANAEVLALGAPLIADLDVRLGDALAEGRALALAADAIRSQRDYERWHDAVLEWRTTAADTLGAGFATTAARDALLESWLSNAPICATWLDSFQTERGQLRAALDFADRVREATSELNAEST